MSTDLAKKAASVAMIKGHSTCKNYFRPSEGCDCDLGAIDGCKSRHEAIATAIDEVKTISDEMVDRALTAWFASPPSETDQGLERSMRSALEAALR